LPVIGTKELRLVATLPVLGAEDLVVVTEWPIRHTDVGARLAGTQVLYDDSLTQNGPKAPAFGCT